MKNRGATRRYLSQGKARWEEKSGGLQVPCFR